jgi:hypothetical protein
MTGPIRWGRRNPDVIDHSVVLQAVPCASPHDAHLSSIQPAAAGNTSLCVRWDADCHQGPEDDASDWSVSFRFCWQSGNGSNQARRSKVIHRENHEQFIFQEAPQRSHGVRLGTGIRVGRRARAVPVRGGQRVGGKIPRDQLAGRGLEKQLRRVLAQCFWPRPPFHPRMRPELQAGRAVHRACPRPVRRARRGRRELGRSCWSRRSHWRHWCARRYWKYGCARRSDGRSCRARRSCWPRRHARPHRSDGPRRQDGGRSRWRGRACRPHRPARRNRADGCSRLQRCRARWPERT